MLNPSDRLVGVSDDPILQLMNTDRFNVSEQSRCERILNHWYDPTLWALASVSASCSNSPSG